MYSEKNVGIRPAENSEFSLKFGIIFSIWLFGQVIIRPIPSFKYQRVVDILRISF